VRGRWQRAGRRRRLNNSSLHCAWAAWPSPLPAPGGWVARILAKQRGGHVAISSAALTRCANAALAHLLLTRGKPFLTRDFHSWRHAAHISCGRRAMICKTCTIYAAVGHSGTWYVRKSAINHCWSVRFAYARIAFLPPHLLAGAEDQPAFSLTACAAVHHVKTPLPTTRCFPSILLAILRDAAKAVPTPHVGVKQAKIWSKRAVISIALPLLGCLLKCCHFSATPTLPHKPYANCTLLHLSFAVADLWRRDRVPHRLSTTPGRSAIYTRLTPNYPYHAYAYLIRLAHDGTHWRLVVVGRFPAVAVC